VQNIRNKYLKHNIVVDLSPDVKISLDLGDLSVVPRGENLIALGYFAKAGFMTATTSINVELSKPLGSGRKHHYVARQPADKDHSVKTGGKADAKQTDANQGKTKDSKTKDGDELPGVAQDANKPADGGQADDAPSEAEIAKFLAPDDGQAQQAMRVSVGEGAEETYKSCKHVATKDFVLKFGSPKKDAVAINMTPPGEQKPVQWELWTYGKIKILVDDHSDMVFMAGAPDVAAADKPAADGTATKSPDPKPSDANPANANPADTKPAEPDPAQSTPPVTKKHKGVFDR
jgi:hypothetical protein